MELKDKLKQLRKEKGLTQAQLAEALFVSRSTVAKWENGLSLPNPEVMTTLEDLYHISRTEIATTEPETIIVVKNRRLRLLGSIIVWSSIIALIVLMYTLPFAIHNGSYGFTPEMAGGVFSEHDHPYIDTGDYRIYYSCFEGDLVDGRHWSILSSFRPVEKHFWGCTVSEDDYQRDVILEGRTLVGYFYSIKGKDGYYNLIKGVFDDDNSNYIVTIESVTIDGKAYDVQNGFFFITPEPVEYFQIGDVFLNVE